VVRPAGIEQGPEAGPERESVRELISDLAGNSGALVRAEIALVRQEIREDLSALRTAVLAVAAGVTLVISGVVTLTQVSVAGLAPRLGPLYAGLIIGCTLVLAGLAFVFGGGRRLGRIGPRPKEDAVAPEGRNDD
jgi:hypothetical protein